MQRQIRVRARRRRRYPTTTQEWDWNRPSAKPDYTPTLIKKIDAILRSQR